jgi:hypothetical protein
MEEHHAAGRRLAPKTAHPAPLAASALRRQTPEVGAVCGNPARTDLCGGRSAISVPTANRALRRRGIRTETMAPTARRIQARPPLSPILESNRVISLSKSE